MDNGLEDLRSCIQDALDEVSPGSRLWRVVSDALANNGSSHPLGLPRRPGRRPLIGWKSRLPPPVSRPIHVKNMKEAGIPSWLCNIRLSATVCETRDRGACTQIFLVPSRSISWICASTPKLEQVAGTNTSEGTNVTLRQPEANLIVTFCRAHVDLAACQSTFSHSRNNLES
jgi:hypothetical protein